MARTCGDYPLLSRGDVNLYSLFVERAMTLVQTDGHGRPAGAVRYCVGKDRRRVFFRAWPTGRAVCGPLYDFENRRTKFNAPPFFPDVDSRFQVLCNGGQPDTNQRTGPLRVLFAGRFRTQRPGTAFSR